jgi:hypothetical protein
VTDSTKKVSPSSSSTTVKEVRSRLQKKPSAIVVDDDDLLDDDEPTGARQQPSIVDIPDDVSDTGEADMADDDEGVEEGLEDPEEALANLIRLTSKPLSSGLLSSEPDSNYSNQKMMEIMRDTLKKMVDLQKVQPAFQSSATTYNERQGRYLVWNSVGTI